MIGVSIFLIDEMTQYHVLGARKGSGIVENLNTILYPSLYSFYDVDQNLFQAYLLDKHCPNSKIPEMKYQLEAISLEQFWPSLAYYVH